MVSYYHPGFKAGGPIRAITSMVEHLGDLFDFWILTADRDYQDKSPYQNVPINQWISSGDARIYYVDVRFLSLHSLKALINQANPDIIYLNSLFSLLANKYLLARRTGIIPQIPTIAAPRGIFSPGALQLKSLKKRIYLQTAQRSGLFNGLTWQASSTLEEKDIRAALPGEKIFIAPDMALAEQGDNLESRHPVGKVAGHVRFIFLSRITPVKNLHFALSLLGSIDGRIQYDLYGPLQDRSYWQSCCEIIDALPPNVQVNYHGSVPSEKVGNLFSNSHFLLLPTLGENFGHVIFEALQAGCPPMISDRTPWNDLEHAGAGWVIPLEGKKKWVETVQYCIKMDQYDFQKYSINARKYVERWSSSTNILEANKNMFLTVASKLEN